MRRESRLARGLWIGLLILIGGYVVADFVRAPFLAPVGSGAVRPAQVTIWTTGGGSSRGVDAVLDGAAATLGLRGHPSAVRRLGGGSAQTTIDFFSGRRRPGALLAVTSDTLADLADDRADGLLPGASEQGSLAQALLARSRPIGILAGAPMVLAVRADSPIASGADLRRSLLADPGRQIFGVAGDTFSRDGLAALVLGIGGSGSSRFSTYRSGGETGGALLDGSVDIALATRPSLSKALAGGRLRRLAWPLSTAAPRSWVALVARPDLPAAEVARLRRWVAGLCRDRNWRRRQEAAGWTPGGGAPAKLLPLLRPAAANRVERVAERVERR